MRIVRPVRQVQLGIAMAALVVMMLVTVADVFMRYAFSQPIRGAYGMTEACLAVFVFHGVSMTFEGRRNVVIDLIDGVVPRLFVDLLIRVADIMSIAVLVLIGWTMIDPAMQAWVYGDLKPELGLPLYYLWAIAGVGVVGTLVSAFGALLSPPRSEGGHSPR
jgi:TRAP-type C4-dicarboxylate transport system permease small subunit